MTDRRTVLITRPEPDAGELAEALEYLGYDCIRAPLLTIRFLDDARPDLTGVTALAFTSANGVRALVHALPDAPGRGIEVFAVGDATARCAREAGFTRVASAGGDATALAGTIAAALKSEDGTVLHVAGRERAGDLVRLLEEKGVAARRAVLYAAEAAEELPWAAHEAIARGEVDDVVIFSPRTARQFVTLIEKAELSRAASRMRLMALSDNVARAAGGLDFASVLVASRPDQAALLNLFALQNVQAAMSDSDKSTGSDSDKSTGSDSDKSTGSDSDKSTDSESMNTESDKSTDKEKDAGGKRKKGKSDRKPDASKSAPKTAGEATPEAAAESDTAMPKSPFADRHESAAAEGGAPASAAPRRRFPVGLVILAVIVILVAAGGWVATQPELRQWVVSYLAPAAAEDERNAQAAVVARLDGLERRVGDLADRVAQDANRGAEDSRVPALAAHVDEIAGKVTALESQAPEGGLAPDGLAPLQEQLAALSARLDTLSARTERVAGPSPQALDSRIAVLGFVSALDTGRPFAPFAEAARARVADMEAAAQTAFDAVMPAAARGVPTPAALAARAAALRLVRAPDTPASKGAPDGAEDASLWDRVKERISGLVTIRRVDEAGETAAPQPAPGLAPVRAALAAGDLGAAAAALDAIDPAPLSDGARIALDALERDVELRRAADDLARALDAAVASPASASPSP